MMMAGAAAEAQERDFEIHIHRQVGQVTGSYSVSATLRPDDSRGQSLFNLPFPPDEITRALGWMEQGLFDESSVKEFGAKLFKALFAGQLHEIYSYALQQGGSRVRLRLILDDPTTSRIPWELLYDPDRQQHLALEWALVRGASIIAPAQALAIKLPLRILVIDAFPEGVPKLESQVEAEKIKASLSSLRSKIDVEVLPHATLASLQNKLREAHNAKKPFHLLHFIGHGQYEPATDRAVLLFEKEQGREIDEVSAQDLVNIIQGYNLKLVFLNACQSLQPSTLDITQGFAYKLMQSGVPAVIGMQITVLDKLAVQFSHDFYEALADNQPADTAVLDARRLLRDKRQRRKADMGIPVFYLRTQTGQLMQVEPSDQVRLTRETWKAWLRQKATPGSIVGGAIGLVGIISGVLGIYSVVIPFFSPPSLMTGDLNIAVAAIGAVDANGKPVSLPEAQGLAASIYDHLNTKLKPPGTGIGCGGSPDENIFDIQVRPPGDTGVIEGASSINQAREAEQLASKINADIVVYGSLQAGPARTVFTPQIYLAQRKLLRAEDLVGQYDLGSSIVVTGDLLLDPDTIPELRERLQGRTEALVPFVLGLRYYNRCNYSKAGQCFDVANKVPGWAEHDDKSVLYMFLGNTAGKLSTTAGDDTQKAEALARAKGYYDQALEARPGYERAQMGQLEVLFQQNKAGGTCDAGSVNVEDLQVLVREFERVRKIVQDSAGTTSNANILSKSAYFMGRGYYCVSQAGIEDRWADAEKEFRSIINEYEAGNKQIQERAADAHGWLGTLYLSKSAGDPVAQRAALQEYTKAAELSQYADHKGYFYVWQAWTSSLLDDCEQASMALDRAKAEHQRARDEGVCLDPDYSSFVKAVQDRVDTCR